jgi:predicted aldo/keto reductase-like oxidoreductase
MDEREIGRREFVRRAAFAAGSVAAGLWLPGRLTADVAGSGASARVTLGTTGVEVSRLGMGTGMRGGGHQSNQTRLGMKAFSELAQGAYERGVAYFDASDNYGSHPFLHEALKAVPRDTLALSTKVEPNSPDGAAADVERFLRELGTDYIDVVVLHCMRRGDWNSRLAHMMDDLSEAKEKKRVRAVGVSCHSVAALQTAATLPWVDVVLARINHDGTKMDAKPEVVVPVLREIHDAGKGVIGMKIAGEGKLVDQLDSSLEFVMRLGCVDAMIIGFEKIAEVEDTISRMERVAAVPAASAA